MSTKNPLGEHTSYPDKYEPGLLFAIPRADSREKLGIASDPPFTGVDIWNAHELSWLTPSGKPAVATAEIIVPADSPHIVESKSLKLYLNSLNHATHTDSNEVSQLIKADLDALLDTNVRVRLTGPTDGPANPPAQPTGICIDNEEVVIPESLSAESLQNTDTNETARETLYTHLFRSLCPVTGQPDWANVSISYFGPAIDHAALLGYLISFRNHNDFHEHCVERIFTDILRHAHPRELTVYARYLRRGGIDINPFRTNTSETPKNGSIWRQ